MILTHQNHGVSNCRSSISRVGRLEINRTLQDADGIAATLWDIAQLELAQEKDADAAPRIAEAYSIVERIGRTEGIAVIGAVFGQILAAGNERELGIAVLRRSADAFRRLGRSQEAEEVERLIQKMGDKQPPGDA